MEARDVISLLRAHHDTGKKKTKSGAEEGPGDANVMLVGDAEAGRTSLISAVLNPNKEDRPKTTVALDYMFARRSTGDGKDVAHIWDLGGGTKLSEIARVPVNADNVHRFAFVLVLDLSKPQNVLAVCEYWLRQIRVVVNAALEELRKRGMEAKADALITAARDRLASDHPDRRGVNPIPVPVVIVGNKYDLFKDLEGVKRKLVAQVLRFIAHQHGAHLLLTSVKEKPLRDQFRHVANHLLFRTTLKRMHEVNGEKTVVVLAGNDTFESIMSKSGSGVESSDVMAGTRGQVSDRATQVWAQALEKLFGPPTGLTDDGAEDHAAWPEPLVDEARRLKDEALAKYRKDAERKAQVAAMERRQLQQPQQPRASQDAKSAQSGSTSPTKQSSSKAPSGAPASAVKRRLSRQSSSSSTATAPSSASAPYASSPLSTAEAKGTAPAASSRTRDPDRKSSVK